jgi:hypothetical protein
VVWLAAAVHRLASAGGQDETFAEALFSSAELPGILVLIALKAFVWTGILVIAMTLWVPGRWSPWIDAHKLGIGITAILGSFGAVAAIHFAPWSWRNDDPRRLVGAAWIVFLSLNGLAVAVLAIPVTIAIRNYVSG